MISGQATAEFEERYAKAMKRLWAHQANDQRPVVREWLFRQDVRHKNVVDIGCGDGYYLDILKPTSYVAVDPNQSLLMECKSRLKQQRITARFFPSIATAVSGLGEATFDLKLLLHSLLYLSLQEAHVVFSTLPAKRSLVVHPDPSNSTTIAFEESMGIDTARELIALKHQVLGKPSFANVANTHLCFDAATTSDEELAFVISHRALAYGDPATIMRKAMDMVRDRRNSWIAGGVVKIPQSQCLESFESQ